MSLKGLTSRLDSFHRVIPMKHPRTFILARLPHGRNRVFLALSCRKNRQRLQLGLRGSPTAEGETRDYRSCKRRVSPHCHRLSDMFYI